MAKVAFTQAAVRRAVKGARAAGVNVTRIEIEPKTGKIIVLSGEQKQEDDLDRELAEWAKGHNDG